MAKDDQDGIPARWRSGRLDQWLRKLSGTGLAKERDEDRLVTVGIFDERTSAYRWIARNVEVAGNMLVMLSYQEQHSGTDLSREYKAFTEKITELSQARLALSQFHFLLLTDHDVKAVFSGILGVLSIRHHSFTVMDIYEGYGLAWSATDGRTAEIVRGRPKHKQT